MADDCLGTRKVNNYLKKCCVTFFSPLKSHLIEVDSLETSFFQQFFIIFPRDGNFISPVMIYLLLSSMSPTIFGPLTTVIDFYLIFFSLEILFEFSFFVLEC